MHVVHRARAILLEKANDTSKSRLDKLFIIHAFVCAILGLLTMAYPHLIAVLFGEEYHAQFRYNPDAETKVSISRPPAAGGLSFSCCLCPE